MLGPEGINIKKVNNTIYNVIIFTRSHTMAQSRAPARPFTEDEGALCRGRDILIILYSNLLYNDM